MAVFRADEIRPYADLGLTEAGAHHLVATGVALVGIDAANLYDSAAGAPTAQRVLREAGIHVVLHVARLADVPARGARFSAVPLGTTESHSERVRAFAEVPE